MRGGVAIYTDVGIEAAPGEVIQFTADGRLRRILTHRPTETGGSYEVQRDGSLVRLAGSS
jgi:hypothetical protein